MRRMVLNAIAIAILVGAGVAVAPSTASGGVGPTTTHAIPGTEFSIELPSHWENPGELPRAARAFKAFLKQHPKMADLMGLDRNAPISEVRELTKTLLRDKVLIAADTDLDGTGDGDNVHVSVYRNQPQITSFDEWKMVQELSAKATNSELVSDAEHTVGPHRGFTHIERYPNGNVYAAMGVNIGRRILSVTMELDPGSEELAAAILGSVRT